MKRMDRQLYDLIVGAILILLAMIFAAYLDMIRAQTCDPVVERPDNPTPVFVTDPLGEGVIGFGLHYRPAGDTEWVLVADIWCVWHGYDAAQGRTRSFASPAECEADPIAVVCTRWCALDQTGVPMQRLTDWEPGIPGEWAATAWNYDARSGYSNVVQLCSPHTCNPAVDPASCSEP